MVTALGAGTATDSYYAGIVVPQLVLTVLSGSLSYVLVPLLSNHEGEDFSSVAWFFFQGIGAVFSLVALVLGVTSSIWVPWTVPGFSSESAALTVSLVRILLAGMVLSSLTSVLWSVYYSKKQFIWCELSPILAQLISLPVLYPAVT